jgi:hypothetical protein
VTIADDDAAPAAPTTPAAPAAPGTPPASPVPAALDKTAPKLTVAAKAIQRALKAKLLALSARCNEHCKLAVIAKLRIGKRTVVLGRAKATRAAGRTARFKVKLSTKALVKLRAATTRGKAKVVLVVKAADDAGNRAAASRRVTVKR